MTSLSALSIGLASVFAVPGGAPIPAGPAASDRVAVDTRGAIFAVGGGDVPKAAYKRMLDLAGGAKNAVVLVFPQASRGADGSLDRDEWLEAGAQTVIAATKLNKRRRQVLADIAKADILWFGGGAQLRLMKALTGAKLVDALVARHRAGAIVGGTSAGAAVLSATMISGRASKGPLRAGMTVYQGIGFWPEVVIDQHFMARERFGRLFTAILDAPSRAGIGVGEDAVAVFEPKTATLSVMGGGQVVVVDARRARGVVGDKAKGGLQAARAVTLHVLRPGDRLPLSP